MPIYEYKCRRCGAVSEYLERQGEWRLFPRKCKACGRRRTRKVVSTFASSVRRSRVETLNELQRMGNVTFSPRQAPAGPHGPPPGGCPYEGSGSAERTPNRQDRGQPTDADRE